MLPSSARAGDRAPRGVRGAPEAPARARLARSNSALGKALLGLLSRGGLDEQAWEDVEDTLLASDLGVEATYGAGRPKARQGKVEHTGRTRPWRVAGCARTCSALVDPSMDHSVAFQPRRAG